MLPIPAFLIKPLIYLAAIVAVVAGIWSYGAYRYHAGQSAGIASERAKWQAAQAELRQKMDDERRMAQQIIEQAERDYLAKRESDRDALSQLNEELSKENADAGDPSCPRRPALSKRLRDILSDIGQ